jgi:protein-L-isoaspartate(D-aspartate) O-methyltransferase
VADDGAALRRALVERLRGQGLLRVPGTAAAFLAVPRERFLPEVARREGLEAVYVNDAIVTKRDARGIPVSSSGHSSLGVLAGPQAGVPLCTTTTEASRTRSATRSAPRLR